MANTVTRILIRCKKNPNVMHEIMQTSKTITIYRIWRMVHSFSGSLFRGVDDDIDSSVGGDQGGRSIQLHQLDLLVVQHFDFPGRSRRKTTKQY